jgi:ribosomal protein S18 acetylase RimI-like enzyme
MFDSDDFYQVDCFMLDRQVTGIVAYGETGLTTATYDLYWLIVHPEHQNEGIGSRLLAHAEEVMRKRGARLIVINTSGKKGYSDVQQFYVRKGYVLEARIRDFYRKNDDLLIYVKRLRN